MSGGCSHSDSSCLTSTCTAGAKAGHWLACMGDAADLLPAAPRARDEYSFVVEMAFT